MTAPLIGRCIGTHAGLNRGVFVRCANCANRHRAGHADIQPALYIDGAGVPQCGNWIALSTESPPAGLPLPGLPGGEIPRAFSSEA